MTIDDAISKASHLRASADGWICAICILEVVCSVLLVPFTTGLSLLFLFAIPITAAVGASATNTKRTAALAVVQAQLLADIKREMN